jgi:proteic killer suppression protein
MSIRSFTNKNTEKLFEGKSGHRFPINIVKRAQRKLGWINNAASLNDLSVPPGNRLEPLTGDRAGQHSIRINQNWRVCFRWNDSDAFDVEVNNHYGD